MIISSLQRHPFLRLLMSFAGGIVCGDALFFRSLLSDILPVWICSASIVLLILAYFLSNKYHIRWLYGVAVFLCCFSLGAGMAGECLHRTDIPVFNEAAVYQAVISEEPEVKERSILCRVLLEEKVGGKTGERYDNTVLLYFPKDSAAALRRGDRLWVHARLAPPANNGNPDEFDYVRYLLRRGVSATAYVPAGHWRVMEHETSRTVRQVAADYRGEVVELYRRLGFRGDNLAVLSALTVGDKENLSEDIRETYSVAGASHVLALSGLHIGLLYGFLFWLFSFGWKRWAFIKPFGVLLIILLLWAFAFFTGLSSSVVRSVIMISFFAVASFQSEKLLSLNTLAATAFLMLVFNPLWLFDVGFQLSFAAVASILLIQPRLYHLFTVKQRILRYIWGIMTVSVAAQIGTAPLIIFYFSRFSTHFLLTNLWVILMVTLILYAAITMLVFTFIPILQHWLSLVVDGLLNAQNGALRWIEQLPASSVDGLWTDCWEIILFYLFLLLMFRCWEVRTARSVYLPLCCLLLLVSYHTVSVGLSAPRRSIVFYNVRRCPAVHCFNDNGDSWLACADSVPDIARLRRALAPHWNRHHLPAPRVLTADYITSVFSFRNHIISYGGKRICLLHDGRWRDKASGHPLPIDYLHISKGYTGSIEELTSIFRIRTVILDSSLSDYRISLLQSDCRRLSIPYISLKEKGALYLNCNY